MKRVLGIEPTDVRASPPRNSSSPTASATASRFLSTSGRRAVRRPTERRPTTGCAFAHRDKRPTLFLRRPDALRRAARRSRNRGARHDLSIASASASPRARPCPRRSARMVRPLRGAHPRRDRLDRDAPHLHQQPPRRRASRDLGPARPRLRGEARRRFGRARARRRGRRALGAWAVELRGLLEPAAKRASRPSTGPGPARATRTCVTPTAISTYCGSQRRHAQGRADLGLACRGRERLVAPPRRARGRRRGPGRRGETRQTQGVRGPQAAGGGVAGARLGAEGVRARTGSRPTNTRAGSSSCPSCRRRRRGRSSGYKLREG